jgi:nucleoid DNA-binding protein
MNKAELVEKIADEAELSKASAERALNSAIDNIIKSITKGDSVQLVGFGTFSQGKRSARVIQKLERQLRLQLQRLLSSLQVKHLKTQ